MRIAVSKTTVRLFSGVGLLLGASLVGANAHAESGALHRWVTAEGTVSYTDDERRVPEKYRDSAETIERGVLSDYGRYTTTDAAAHQANAEQLAKRLDALRAMNAPMDADREEGDVATSNSSSTVEMRRNVHTRTYRRNDTVHHRTYDSGPSQISSLPVDPNDPSPVITEERHMLWPGRTVTETVTVTRQGDRVLSIYRPRTHYHATDYPRSIEDLTDND
jgi:hypothetical protein